MENYKAVLAEARSGRKLFDVESLNKKNLIMRIWIRITGLNGKHHFGKKYFYKGVMWYDYNKQ